MSGRMLDIIGGRLAAILEKPIKGYVPATPPEPEALVYALRPADIILVEGNSRVSSVIKYLTQSTWSHAAMYVGPVPGKTASRTASSRPTWGRRRHGRLVEIQRCPCPGLPSDRH